MALAQIAINGQVGANDEVLLNEEVILSNNDDNGVLTWEWDILSAPPNSTAELSDSTLAMPTFTPDKVGSYLIQLIVNDGESVHKEIVSVVGARTGIRIPAFQEQMEFGGQGWAESRYRDLLMLEHFMASGAPVVCRNTSGDSIAKGKVVKIGIAEYREQIPVPSISIASAGDGEDNIYGIAAGTLEGGDPINSGELGIVIVMGPVACDASTFVPDSAVYLGMNGDLEAEGSTRIGKVILAETNGCVFVYPQFGTGEGISTYEAAIYPRFLLFGGPLDEYPIAEPIDGRYPIPESGYLRWVIAVRVTPGDSGETIANVFLNGASLLSGDNRIKFQASGSSDQIGYALLNENVVAGDLLDVRLEEIETGFAEDLFIAAFIHVSSPATRMEFRGSMLGPLNVLEPDVPVGVERFTVPLTGTIKTFGFWRETVGDSGNTSMKLVRIRDGIETELTIGGDAPSVSPVDGGDAISFASGFSDSAVQEGDVLEMRLTSIEDGDPYNIMASATIKSAGAERSVYPFFLWGPLSVPEVPYSIDGKYPVLESGEIVKVSAHRQEAGTSGETIFDVRVNGLSIFSDSPYPYPYGGPYPSGSGGIPATLPRFGIGDQVIHVEEFVLTSVSQNDLIEVFVLQTEEGNPENLFVTITVNT